MADLTPEGLEEHSFTYSVWGYKRAEVDEYLDRIARAWGASLDSARERAFMDLGERMGELLQHAKDAADGLVGEATAAAGVIRADARAEARTILDRTAVEAARVTEEARVQAEERVAQAESRVQELNVEEAHTRDRISSLRRSLGEVGERLASLEPATVVLPDTAEVAKPTTAGPEPR